MRWVYLNDDKTQYRDMYGRRYKPIDILHSRFTCFDCQKHYDDEPVVWLCGDDDPITICANCILIEDT